MTVKRTGLSSTTFSRMKKDGAGFTLIEIIIVVAIIAILASAVIIAINPAKNLRQARNATRWTQMNAAANGIYSYVIDNQGLFPTCLYLDSATRTERYVYDEATTSPNLWGLKDLSLCAELVPTYIGKIPAEPQGAEYMVGFIEATSSDRIIIKCTAPEALTEDIMIIQ